MRAVRAKAAASAWLLAAACTSVEPRRAPPSPDLRIWAPVVVHWPPGAERSMRFAIENATQRTVEVREPHPRAARVDVFEGPDGPRVCGKEPADPPGEEAVRLAPGDQFPVTVDLEEACGDLPPGEYRYELSYRMPEEGGGGTVLRTRYGRLVIEGSRAAARRRPQPLRPPEPRDP